MVKEQMLKELNSEIEDKRRELNFLITRTLDKDRILKYSMELDKLIDRYYHIQLEER